jgi:hypothetical protein
MSVRPKMVTMRYCTAVKSARCPAIEEIMACELDGMRGVA